MDPVRIASDLFTSSSRSFAVRLWDGTVLPPPRDAGLRGAVVLRTPRVLEAFFPPAAEHRLADAFVEGALDLEGDAISLIEAAARWTGPRASPSLVARALAAVVRRALRGRRAAPLEARMRGPRHSVGRDRDAVRHHYDLPDDFYRLFLDDAMVYSCAYFPRGAERLEDAQRAKLAGRADVAVREDDYRTLRAEAPFDKVASVGMMEHVGRARLDAYFAAVHRLLRPGGLFLNHAIADVGGGRPTLPWAGQAGGGFIWRYVFPDGELIPIAEVIAAAERGGFEVRDLECLREHYAETLAAWLGRLEARFDEAVAIAGERRARLYRLYLAASAVGFRIGRTSVYQLLLAKRTASGRAEGLPRSRAAWHAWEAAPRAPAAAAFAGGDDGREPPAAP